MSEIESMADRLASEILEPGDLVQIESTGGVYPSYESFFVEQGMEHLAENWDKGKSINAGDLCIIEHIGQHIRYPRLLCIVRDINNGNINIVNITRLALVKKNGGFVTTVLPDVSEDEFFDVLEVG